LTEGNSEEAYNKKQKDSAKSMFLFFPLIYLDVFFKKCF